MLYTNNLIISPFKWHTVIIWAPVWSSPGHSWCHPGSAHDRRLHICLLYTSPCVGHFHPHFFICSTFGRAMLSQRLLLLSSMFCQINSSLVGDVCLPMHSSNSMFGWFNPSLFGAHRYVSPLMLNSRHLKGYPLVMWLGNQPEAGFCIQTCAFHSAMSCWLPKWHRIATPLKARCFDGN